MTNGDESAWGGSIQTGYGELLCIGLTKREVFAAMAMQGYLASHPKTGYKGVAEIAVMQADALIEALNKEQA